MAIKKSFGGSTILKPGPYSITQVDNSAGSDSIGAADICMIIGEAELGAPGSSAGIQSFPSTRLGDLISMYGEGPLVDCAVAAARPSKQNGVGGAGTILVWKTNASTQASVMLKKSGSNIIQVLDLAFGAPGNGLSVIVTDGTVPSTQKQIQIARVGAKTEVLGQNAAQQVMSIEYTGNGSAATVAIAGASQSAKVLTTVLTGASDGSVGLSIPLANYNMLALVNYINAQQGYVASLITVPTAQTPATNLDPIAATSIHAVVLPLLQIQVELVNLINTSQNVSAVLQATPVVGIIDDVASAFLVGGAQGASANSDFANGMAASLSEDYNNLLCAVSRDASVDVADALQGFTDPTSTYTVAAIHAAQDSHLRLRASVKNKKEAGGWGGYRASTKATAFAYIANVGSEFEQICMQDVLMVDANSNQVYKHPHVEAAFAMGMRCGTAVGEPLTFKYPQVQAVGHFVNPVTGISAGDFNPSLDYDAAIQAGVLFLEKAAGGFRWVVDNTTYGTDNSFVYNRGSVMQAVFYVNKTLRQVAEDIFIGRKVSNGAAQSIKNAVGAALTALNAPDVNIITASGAIAPNGYRLDTFVVTIVGNTATVQVEYIPVQGLDFVFYEFTLGDIQQTA